MNLITVSSYWVCTLTVCRGKEGFPTLGSVCAVARAIATYAHVPLSFVSIRFNVSAWWECTEGGCLCRTNRGHLFVPFVG